jgi:hypothetical protein
MEIQSKKPVIYNLTLTLANTEYSQELPIRTSRVQIQPRQDNDIKVSFALGESGTKYFTVKGGMNYFEWEMMKCDGQLSIYAQSATAGTVVEVLAWVGD